MLLLPVVFTLILTSFWPSSTFRISIKLFESFLTASESNRVNAGVNMTHVYVCVCVGSPLLFLTR